MMYEVFLSTNRVYKLSTSDELKYVAKLLIRSWHFTNLGLYTTIIRIIII